MIGVNMAPNEHRDEHIWRINVEGFKGNCSNNFRPLKQPKIYLYYCQRRHLKMVVLSLEKKARVCNGHKLLRTKEVKF